MKNYDYCIVGSGPAGAFAAYELASAGNDVVVIEAGSNEVDIDPNNFVDLSQSKVQGNVDFGFSKQIGGASNLWAGGLARYDHVDLLSRKEFGLPGWLISYNELDKYYCLVDRYVGVDKQEETMLNTECGQLDCREMRVLDTPYKTSRLLNHENITLLSNCSVVSLKKHGENSERIKFAEIYDNLNKENCLLHAKTFVLAAGTVSNVRILLHSFDSKELDCYDAIGRYISTHPKIDIGYLKLFEKASSQHLLISIEKLNNYLLRCQFGLSKKVLIENSLLNHCVRFDSIMIGRAIKVFELLKSKLGLVPIVNKSNAVISRIIVRLGLSIFQLIDGARYKGSIRGKLYVRGFFDQRARMDNRITLSNQCSTDGLPLAKIEWNFDDKDWDNVNKFVKFLTDELYRNNIGEFVYKKPNINDIVGIHSHFIGGLRMGDDVYTSVVDESQKIHGLSNLYISGPSVFPSYGYANPFYTIAAMSIRLGKHLANEKE